MEQGNYYSIQTERIPFSYLIFFNMIINAKYHDFHNKLLKHF